MKKLIEEVVVFAVRYSKGNGAYIPGAVKYIMTAVAGGTKNCGN